MKILSQKKAKKAEGFQIWHCYWLFSSDIMAVKGLMNRVRHLLRVRI